MARNITLIGMPGSGKSFVGERLAKRLGYRFLAVDPLLEQKFGKKLQAVVDMLGDQGFIAEEARSIIAATEGLESAVISPGGSIVYSPEAMEHLAGISEIVYLDVPLDVLTQRIGDAPRGIVGLRGRTLEELYAERVPLYTKWADMTVDGSNDPDRIIAAIAHAMSLEHSS